MAEIKEILSAVITTGSKLSELPIKNYQLIFVKDTQTIALDFNGKRTTYSQVITVQTEAERQAILAPIHGLFYFVQDSCCLWTFDNTWKQITSPPKDVIMKAKNISEFPPLGNELCLYIAQEENKMYRWDDTDIKYYCVGSDYNDIKIINGGSA